MAIVGDFRPPQALSWATEAPLTIQPRFPVKFLIVNKLRGDVNDIIARCKQDIPPGTCGYVLKIAPP